MKIFFGGSLHAFQENSKSYLEIRKTLLTLRQKLTRDWIREELRGKVKRNQNEMYELTEKAIHNADAVILEYTHNTSAAGQQLILALERGLPTLLLVKNSKNAEDSLLSDYFVNSKHYKYLKKERYNGTNVKKIIVGFLKWADQNRSIVRFNLELEKELDDYLKEKALANRTSKSEEIRKLVLEDLRHRR